MLKQSEIKKIKCVQTDATQADLRHFFFLFLLSFLERLLPNQLRVFLATLSVGFVVDCLIGELI